MARLDAKSELLRTARELSLQSRTDALSIRQTAIRSEATIETGWALLRKLERLEVEFFGRSSG
jgi:hypothetical protein